MTLWPLSSIIFWCSRLLGSLYTPSLPNPGGKPLHSVFHAAATPSSSCTLWSKPTRNLPSRCRGKTRRWSCLAGFSTSDPRLCGFLLRSQCEDSLPHSPFLLPTHLWDSYIAFNTMQLCTLRSGGKETIIWHTGAINYFKFIFLCECGFFLFIMIIE